MLRSIEIRIPKSAVSMIDMELDRMQKVNMKRLSRRLSSQKLFTNSKTIRSLMDASAKKIRKKRKNLVRSSKTRSEKNEQIIIFLKRLQKLKSTIEKQRHPNQGCSSANGLRIESIQYHEDRQRLILPHSLQQPGEGRC